MGVLDPHRKIGDSKPARAVQGALLVRAVGWAFLLRWSGARRVGDHARLQALCFCVSNGCVVARVFGPEMFLFANKQQSLKSWTSTATAASEVRSFLSWAAVGCSGIQGSAVLVAGRQVQGCQGCQGNGQWVSTAQYLRCSVADLYGRMYTVSVYAVKEGCSVHIPATSSFN